MVWYVIKGLSYMDNEIANIALLIKIGIESG